MGPRALIQKWIDTFNQGDADGLAALYHEDAINHQVVFEPITGRAAIHEMFRQEFAKAEMTCIPENIFEDKDWAILEWKDPKGLRGCGFFQVEDGLIKFQRGYWDQLSFFRQQNLPIPKA